MNTITHAHINQKADENNNLRVDNIEIFCEVSKNGQYLIAKSAMEYFVEDTETETKEWEEEVLLDEALQSFIRPIGKVSLIDGKVPVECSDGVWRVLVWIDEDGNGKCFIR
jgi:hypothetical protein